MNITSIEICIFILLVIVFICVLNIHFRKIETFTEPNKNDVVSEVDKQLYMLYNSSKVPIDAQTVSYLPHLDIINDYKGKSKQFLNTLDADINNNLVSKRNELNKLDNYVRSLARYKDDNILKQLKNADFKSIKSHNNGQSLNVNRISYDKYQVMMNNGCLKVTPENDYNVVPCDLNDIGQQFKLEHLFNEREYRGSMDKAFPQISNLGNVHYPMSMVKSVVNDNCLKNHHGNISVEPCREYEGQRWASTRTTNKCETLF